jgi:hypothetical protein
MSNRVHVVDLGDKVQMIIGRAVYHCVLTDWCWELRYRGGLMAFFRSLSECRETLEWRHDLREDTPRIDKRRQQLREDLVRRGLVEA